jgi:hypothetical protein
MYKKGIQYTVGITLLLLSVGFEATESGGRGEGGIYRCTVYIQVQAFIFVVLAL